jgi:hypothetical protein
MGIEMATIDQMWERLAQHQPFADERGYGEAWRMMCDERTEDAAGEAAYAAWDAAGEAAYAAWDAAWAAAEAAVDAARAESGAKQAIECIEKAEGKQ